MPGIVLVDRFDHLEAEVAQACGDGHTVIGRIGQPVIGVDVVAIADDQRHATLTLDTESLRLVEDRRDPSAHETDDGRMQDPAVHFPPSAGAKINACAVPVVPRSSGAGGFGPAHGRDGMWRPISGSSTPSGLPFARHVKNDVPSSSRKSEKFNSMAKAKHIFGCDVDHLPGVRPIRSFAFAEPTVPPPVREATAATPDPGIGPHRRQGTEPVLGTDEPAGAVASRKSLGIYNVGGSPI
ncbi:MAG: hypothetical protein R3C97_10530 [Geminicoccaceae bacterium]